MSGGGTVGGIGCGALWGIVFVTVGNPLMPPSTQTSTYTCICCLRIAQTPTIVAVGYAACLSLGIGQ